MVSFLTKKIKSKVKKIKSFARSELHTLVEMTYMKKLLFFSFYGSKNYIEYPTKF